MPMISQRLHVAESMEKLQEKANLDKSGIVTYTTNQLCNSAKKLLQQANEEYTKKHDEELAFVYYFKFLELVIYLKNKKDFKTNSLFDYLTKSAETAMASATKLKNSLTKRYAMLSEINSEKESSEDVSKSDPAVGSPTRKDDVEKITDAVIDTTPDHSISVGQLYSLMTMKEKEFLILDIRSKEDFDESHIKHPSCVNVPEEILKPGMTCSQLEQKLPPLAAIKWESKNHVDLVIILDWETTDTCLPKNHPIHTLEEAMMKWDTKNPLTKPPLILIGGYKEWLFRYPMFTTKALNIYSMEKPDLPDTVPNVSGVDYPDLDAALKDEIGSETVNSNIARFASASSSPRGLVNGWVNDPVMPDRGSKPLVNRLAKPTTPLSSNTAFVSSKSTNNSEEKPNIVDKREAASSSKMKVPEFNRNLKPSWATKSSNIADALKQETIAAEETLVNAQEQLRKEKEFEELRLRKELEAEEGKRIELQKQEELLLENLRALQKQNEKHEQEYLVLKEENLKMKKLLEAHRTEEEKSKEKEIEKIETKKKELMKEVDRMRQERKRKEQKNSEMRPHTSPSFIMQENEKNLLRSSSKEQANYAQDKEYTIPLNDTPESPNRGLTRSYSSPNIAQLVAEQNIQSRRVIPTVDRSLKPKFDIDYKVSYDDCLVKMRNLNPTHGSVPCRPATGLRNLGNTCYMNSIIQCLSNTKQLVDYFNWDKYKPHVKRSNKHGTNGEIVMEFAFIIKSLWAGHYRSFSPKDFKNTASKFIPMCVGYEQQDSHEFLVVLMDKLHADLNQGHPADPLPDLDSCEVSIATEKFWNHHRAKNRSKISDTFEGLIRSSLTCLNCGKTSNSYEVFSCLSLPISSSACTLKDSLDTFLKPEKISGDGAWECPRCRLKKEAKKTLTFSKLPDVLVIQLKRFSYEGMWRRKIQSLVRFTFNLELGAESGCNRKYSLYGIVNHFGYLEGGHYTAYCKSPDSHKWYKYDDHEVSEISSSDIVTTAAYLLFYSAIDSGRD